MSQLEPDELARLLTQAVEPIRGNPEGYQRIQAGIERRRRMRLPLYALAGVATAAVFALALLALQPRQSTHVVEPAGPVNGSVSGSGPDAMLSPSQSWRGGSGGSQDGGGSTQAPSVPVTPRASQPGSAPTGAATASPGTRPTGPSGGSPTMPPPTQVPAKDGDIDGDGGTDTITTAGLGLEVTLSRGPVVVVPLPSLAAPLRSTVVDVNNDGYGEIFVRTTAANGVERFLMLRLMPSSSISFVTGSETRLIAGIETTTGSASGFRCQAGSLVTYSGTPAGGGSYSLVTRTWRLQGTDLVADSAGTTSFTTDTSLFRPDCGML